MIHVVLFSSSIVLVVYPAHGHEFQNLLDIVTSQLLGVVKVYNTLL